MADIYLDINGLSKHSDDTYKERGIVRRHNENNSGLGVRYEWGDPTLTKFVTAGGYRNSRDRDTTYAGGGILKRIAGNDTANISIGAQGGVASGYYKDRGMPFAMPVIGVGLGDSRINLSYAPKTKDSSETYMLSMSYKLGSTKERAARIKEHMLKKDE